jgi:hypothetical protein
VFYCSLGMRDNLQIGVHHIVWTRAAGVLRPFPGARRPESVSVPGPRQLSEQVPLRRPRSSPVLIAPNLIAAARQFGSDRGYTGHVSDIIDATVLTLAV